MPNCRVTAEQALEGFVVPKNSHAIANLTKFMKVTIMILTDISPFLVFRTLSIGSSLTSSGVWFTFRNKVNSFNLCAGKSFLSSKVMSEMCLGVFFVINFLPFCNLQASAVS